MLYKDSADCHGVNYNPVTHFCKSSTGDLGTRSICAKTPASADQFNIDIRYDSEENVDSHEGQMCDSRDYQVYDTKTVGGLTWMMQALRYALPKDNNGKTADLDSGSFCYDNDCRNYNGARAYLWSAVVDSAKNKCGYEKAACEAFKEPFQGVCPTGWHVPGEAEVATYTSSVAALVSGDKGPVAWQSDIDASTLAGRKIMGYTFDDEISWTISDKDDENAYYISWTSGTYDKTYAAKYYALPVRCIKNPS